MAASSLLSRLGGLEGMLGSRVVSAEKKPSLARGHVHAQLGHPRMAVSRGGMAGQPGRRSSLRCQAQGDNNSTGKHSTLDHIPVAPFYKVEAIIRSWRLQGVTEALLQEGIRGLTVTDVRGFGAQRGSLERQAGTEFVDSAFLQKTKMEIVVVAEQVDTVIDTITDSAKTEEIGDGKIFVSPVYEVVRVRTGERGVQAERMAGGRSDLLNIGEKEHT